MLILQSSCRSSRRFSLACERWFILSVVLRCLRRLLLITMTASASCRGSSQFIVDGPAEMTGRYIGHVQVGDGGRIAYGYTATQARALDLPTVDRGVGRESAVDPSH